SLASTVLPSACSERVGTREKRRWRGAILCLRVPLSTLRQHRYRCLRMTRGQCGWLDLHCLGLAPCTTVPACPERLLLAELGTGNPIQTDARLRGLHRPTP